MLSLPRHVRRAASQFGSLTTFIAHLAFDSAAECSVSIVDGIGGTRVLECGAAHSDACILNMYNT